MEGRISALENARLVIELEDEERQRELARRQSTEYLASLELLKAVRLCPHLNLCIAFMQGQPVGASWLDPYWLHRYGVKRRPR